MTDDKLIAATCDISDMIMRLKFGKTLKEIILTNDDGSTEYKETSQDTFNEIYDRVENLILEIVEIKENK
tara:strand:- start:36 stop:245 length:210 start_codon:yes stop_codon:yes gene_type:complete